MLCICAVEASTKWMLWKKCFRPANFDYIWASICLKYKIVIIMTHYLRQIESRILARREQEEADIKRGYVIWILRSLLIQLSLPCRQLENHHIKPCNFPLLQINFQLSHFGLRGLPVQYSWHSNSLIKKKQTTLWKANKENRVLCHLLNHRVLVKEKLLASEKNQPLV